MLTLNRVKEPLEFIPQQFVDRKKAVGERALQTIWGCFHHILTGCCRWAPTPCSLKRCSASIFFKRQPVGKRRQSEGEPGSCSCVRPYAFQPVG